MPVNEFAHTLHEVDQAALKAVSIDTLMINVGLRCNMACTHCHQSCSPLRTETMSRQVLEISADIARDLRPKLVDITGGAPELHPDLRYLIALLGEAGLQVQVRTNLTALLEPESAGLVESLARYRVRMLASFPGTTAEEIFAQRGDAFVPSIRGLRALAAAGYGSDPALRLDIAVNPVGARVPVPGEFEARFRETLTDELGIPFDKLVVITNVPIGRFRDVLSRNGELGSYQQDLRDAFNPDTVGELSCRRMLEIAWDGTFSDCDFNLGAGLRVSDGMPADVWHFDAGALATRPIRFAAHCFACTARGGSG